MLNYLCLWDKLRWLYLCSDIYVKSRPRLRHSQRLFILNELQKSEGDVTWNGIHVHALKFTILFVKCVDKRNLSIQDKSAPGFCVVAEEGGGGMYTSTIEMSIITHYGTTVKAWSVAFKALLLP